MPINLRHRRDDRFLGKSQLTGKEKITMLTLNRFIVALTVVLTIAAADLCPAGWAWAGPDVNVVNTAANPVLTVGIDNPAIQPIQLKAVVTLTDGAFNSFSAFTLPGTSTPFIVPTGKRLVIEYAAIVSPLPPNQTTFVALQPVLSGVAIPFNLAVFKTGAVQDFFVASQQVRLYADPNTSVSFLVTRLSNSGGGGEHEAHIMGHFVNLNGL
jgi:hypothetical protein